MKQFAIALAALLSGVLAASAQLTMTNVGSGGFGSGGASLACSYTPVTTGTQGTAYTGATPSASGGTPSYTFSETGTLPGGLSISSSTGVISGTPAASGSFPSIQVKVTDSTSTVANCGSSFTLVISAPPSYAGPGDVVASAAAYWGLRAYSASAAGTAAINLCDDTGANCSDVSTNSSTGALNSPGTHGTNNCATSGTCLIDTIYDQSGANNCSGLPCNATQATVARMPKLNLSCVGGQPCMVCNGSALVSGTPTSISQPFTILGTTDRTGAAGSYSPWYGDNSENVEIGSANSTNLGYMASSLIVNTTSALSDSSFHAIQGVFNGASSTFNADGSSLGLTGNPGTTAASTQHNICADNNGGDRHFIGNVTEVGIWGSGFNSTQISNMNSNQHAFWGF